MLMMRLQRIGRKNNPSYRIVVVDKRTSVKSNKIIDLIGTYNPKAGEIVIKAEKANHWLANGVQPSDTVHNMLVSKQIINSKKRNNLPKKSPVVNEKKLATEDEVAETKPTAEVLTEAEVIESVATMETPAEEVATKKVSETDSVTA